MTENTAEKFLLLIQHPEKSRFILSDPYKKSGLVGSILLDLSYEGKIDVENGRLVLKKPDTDLSAIHKEVLDRIQKSSKDRKVKTWISRFSGKSARYQREILRNLEDKGIIRMEPKRFLFFKYYRTKLIKHKVRDQIIKEIRETLLYNKQVNDENSLILGLVEACNMYRIICRDKKERKICKTRIKEWIQSDVISQGVGKVIKEMQAAVIGAVVASSAAASSGSN